MSNALTEAINNIKIIEQPILEYRWYYNENGDITHCASNNHPEGENYIIVDKEMYNCYTSHYILNGEPKEIPVETAIVLTRLVKSDKGFPVVKNHASILIEDNETYNDIEYYDNRDS